MKKLNSILAGSIAASYLIAGSAFAADPSAVNVTLYKTEVCNDTACTTILDNTAGVTAELVSGDGAFGDAPAVDVGSYNRFRFTLQNQILVSGTPDAPCSAITDQSSKIDSSLAPTEQVTISFATGDAAIPGSTGWYANGTTDHPFFMSAPVVVAENGTTDVTVQFNTADTLGCAAGLAVIDAPTFAVSSYVQPPASTTFAGGDYWLVGTNAHNPWLSAESSYTAGQFLSGAWPTTAITQGQMIEPEFVAGTSVYEVLLNSADAEKYQAQIRSHTTREMRWGMKVRISAPDATGEGNISIVRTEGHQRFAFQYQGGNESFAAAPASDTTPEAVGTYQLDASNRLTLFINGDTPIQGALSDDYQTLIVADTSDGISINMGVKVNTGSTTMPNNVYSWNSYMIEVGRDDNPANAKTSNGTAIDGDEVVNAYYHGSVGWIDVTDFANAAMASIGAKLEVQNPDLTTVSSTASQSDEADSGDFTSFFTAFVDGAGMVGPLGENWMAVTPSGQVGIMTGAAEYDTRYSDDAYVAGGSADAMYDYRVQKNTSFNVLVQLADAGVHSMTSLAGTYFIGGLWDDLNSGNSSFGGNAGEVTLNADGTGAINISNVDNLNRVNTDANTIGWEIFNACIGVTGTAYPDFVRMEIDSPTCVADGGKIIDTIVVYDPATPTEHQAAIFPSEDGKAMTFFDPQSLDVSGQNRRSLGMGVKLR